MLGSAKGAKTAKVLKMWHFTDLNITKKDSKQNQEVMKSKRPISQNFVILKRCSPDVANQPEQNMSNFNVKEVVDVKMELCRVCLEQGTISIHGDCPTEDLAHAISTFGGIDVNIFDSCPKYLCEPCNGLLQGAILFRKTAQSSDRLLKKSTASESTIHSIGDMEVNLTTHMDIGHIKPMEQSMEEWLNRKFENPTESEPEIDDHSNSMLDYIVPEVSSILEPKVCLQTAQDFKNLFKQPNLTHPALNASSKFRADIVETPSLYEKQLNLTCKQCNLRFNFVQDYKDHKLRTRKHKTKICTVCKEADAVQFAKKYYPSTEKTFNMYVCDICYENMDDVPETNYFTIGLGMEHCNRNLEEQTVVLTCKECDVTFDKFQDYREHRLYTRKHMRKMCTVCNKTYAIKCTKKYNPTTEETKNMYMCDVCYGNRAKVFSKPTVPKTNDVSNDVAKELVNKALTDQKVVLTCTQCEIEFDKYEDYEEHRQHTKKHMKKMCVGCNDTYAVKYVRNHSTTINMTGVYVCDGCSKKDLNELAKRIAEAPRSFVVQQLKLKCKQCNLSFDAYPEYRLHKRTHERRTKMCLICNQTYSAKYYRVHMQIHKEGEPAYVCDICGTRFRQRNSFSRHRETHFNRLRHKCSLCPYKTQLSSSLRIHMRSHTGERPYLCEECPQKFVTKSNLIKHRFTHKVDFEFKCECGKGYHTKRDLGIHVTAEHVGIKQHVCHICGKAYGYRKVLMRHQLRVHKRKKLKGGRKPTYLNIDSTNNQDMPTEATV